MRGGGNSKQLLPNEEAAGTYISWASDQTYFLMSEVVYVVWNEWDECQSLYGQQFGRFHAIVYMKPRSGNED